ncbi:MAG TPA: hypothetical protein VD794_11280 [Flavisolibacter sp.]|nr:hypothetical protein [Flavisolibacter sp.]
MFTNTLNYATVCAIHYILALVASLLMASSGAATGKTLDDSIKGQITI